MLITLVAFYSYCIYGDISGHSISYSSKVSPDPHASLIKITNSTVLGEETGLTQS